MKRSTVLIVPLLVACAQEAVPLDESEKPVPPPVEGEATAVVDAPPAKSTEEAAKALDPVQTCQALVEAAKASDPEAFGALATAAAIEAMAKDEELTKGVLGAIAQVVCGEVTVQGDTATVSVSMGENTRDIPLTQIDGTWRFDGAAYLDRYPMERVEKPAPRKGKKGKKRKRRRRKD